MSITKGVVGGTRSGEGMCTTCRYSSTTLGPAQTQEFIYCHAFGLRVLMPVLQCSRYDDRRLPSLSDMYEMAWYLTTSDQKQPIGFVSAREWRRKQNEGDPVTQGPGAYPTVKY